MKKIILIFLYLLFHAIVIAQTQHFSFTNNTGETYSIVVNNATLDGNVLQVGDEIGVFTPASLCVGASVWDGNTPLALTAWANNSQTQDVDGYQTGEAMSFKIWDASAETEFEAESVFGQGNGNFGDGAYSIVSLSVIRQTDKTIIVTNTNDSGQGSLRDAINQANTDVGPDTILFQIQISDPNFNSETGVWTISHLSPLPLITDSAVVIDGTSQTIFAGDHNFFGPEIQLDGSHAAGNPAHGLFIISGKNEIRGLIINRFRDSGILLSGPSANNNLIVDNYIGVNAIADNVLPNGQYGVYIAEGSRNSIGLLPPGQKNNLQIKKNKPMSKINKQDMLQGLNSGGNLIAGNLGGGIYIIGQVATENKILWNSVLSNFNHGIVLQGAASYTQIFLNTIAFNNGAGVLIDGENSIQNTILTNAITQNTSDGIILNGGNLMMPAPTIQVVTDTSITGTASPNALVQLFGDPEDEGEIILGEASSDEYGNFSWTGFVTGNNITATATDQNGNTSPFSTPFPFGGDLFITTTTDNGSGSLREAIQQANTQSGPNRILFQIPLTDDGYDSNTGVWTIRPETRLPDINDEDLVIDGYSQVGFIGTDTNSEGPEIELDGSLIIDSPGFNVIGSGAIIAGLVINRFNGFGISMSGVDGGIITGCYIGTDAKGMQSLGNLGGILLYHNVRNVIIGPPDSTLSGNLISGNVNSGIKIMDSCRNNHIIGNYIGPNLLKGEMSEKNVYGIYIRDHSDSNNVSFNLIGNNQLSGLLILKSNANYIFGNDIGAQATWQLNLGNHEDGIKILNAE